MSSQTRHGFTLIELSIVLVIIGLIVGGILVGQDLIRAAEIRATVGQIEKYNTSVNTFRTKFGYLPGDLPSRKSTTLGFFAETTLGGTVGHQDGNNLIEGGVGGFSIMGRGELLGFWRHLTDAQMVDGNFGTISSGNPLIDTTGLATLALAAGTVNQLFPPAKIGRGNYIAAFSSLGSNYFQITGISAMTAPGMFTLNFALTPLESHNIDAKNDDGLPLVGNVQAMRSASDLGLTAGPGNACVTAGSLYDLGVTNGNVPSCQLRLRFN